MHWSLSDLREMALDEYHELLTWASEKSQDPDSTDADRLIEARRNKDRQDTTDDE